MAAKLKVGKTAVTKALDTLEAESLVQLMLLNSLDNTQDTKYADEMMSKILNKDNPSIH